MRTRLRWAATAAVAAAAASCSPATVPSGPADPAGAGDDTAGEQALQVRMADTLDAAAERLHAGTDPQHVAAELAATLADGTVTASRGRVRVALGDPAGCLVGNVSTDARWIGPVAEGKQPVAGAACR